MRGLGVGWRSDNGSECRGDAVRMLDSLKPDRVSDVNCGCVAMALAIEGLDWGLTERSA
jgi:hypothetical protein